MKWFFSKSQRKLWHEPINGASWECEARNDVVDGCTGCPNGTFPLRPVEWNEPNETNDLRSMGPAFIPINNTPDHDGIGLHGGGTASPHPLAAKQGWFPTEDCVRVQNDDLYHITENVGLGDTLTVTD